MEPSISTSHPPRDPNRLQQQASNPEVSVWVSASAGSGKTKVLTDRVLRLLLNGAEPQKLLCLTFTRAAAAQMAIRVTDRLAAWATAPDDILYAQLDALQGRAPKSGEVETARRLFAKVLNAPGGLRLRTIHAFCQEILGRFPLESGLTPNFTVLEESESQALLADSFTDILGRADERSAAGKALRLLAARVESSTLFALLQEGMKEPERLDALLKQAGGANGLLQKQRQAAGLTEGETRDTLIRQTVADIPTEALRAKAVLLLEGAKTFAEKGQRILDYLTLSPTAQRRTFADYASIFLTQEDTPSSRLAGSDAKKKDPTIADFMATEAARLAEAVGKIRALELLEEGHAVFILSNALAKAYAARKKNRSALDFDDMIACVQRLMRREAIAPWVLFKLDGGLDHILVDEAQDTSPDQWEIVDALAREFFSGVSARDNVNRTLFVVGDEKQSIYSFRGADPAVFSVMNRHFEDLATGSGGRYEQVPLNISFRSAPAILRGVDAVFANEATRHGVAIGAIEHEAFNRQAAGRVAITPLFIPLKQAKEEGWSLPLSYEAADNPSADLATDIAARIAGWLRDPFSVRGRPVAPGDILILVQRRNALLYHLVRALKKNNVPVAGIDRMTLTEQTSVMDLMALLQFILLPEDDLNLATLLRGPLIGLSEEALMDIAIRRKPLSLWQSLAAKPAYQTAQAYLAHWLGRADRISPFVLLAEILHTPCPADPVSGRKALWKRLGPEAMDPVDEMLNAAESFSARKSTSLQAFLQDLLQNEVEIKREAEQAGGQVRLMTIHAAKGLEAPVVILPDTTHLPDAKYLNKILWDTETNLPFYVPRESALPLFKKLREAAREKQMEEYRRLLYVALTRAGDRLYLCGYTNQRSDKTGRNWYDLTLAALKGLDDPTLHTGDEVAAFGDTVSEERPSLPTAANEAEPTSPPPAWAFTEAPKDAEPPRPFAPSRPTEPEPASLAPHDRRFLRGRVMHKLLQVLPDIEPTARPARGARYLADPQHGLTQAEQAEILAEILALFENPEVAPLFGPESRAEVPLVGLCGNRLVSGQVDRLAVFPDEVWVVDYKTNRPPPATESGVPRLYWQQMAAYAHLLQSLYPDRKIRCFLLWTHAPRLMPLPEAGLKPFFL